MSVIVFAGPSLPPSARQGMDDILFLPPAAQGDVLAAMARYRPRVIGLIDGYFEGVPAVWHKELLHALGQGVHVYGAASMGALRAAELASFGMTGVGAIYRAYASGALVADDAVALVHGPAEAGFPSLSEALVNVQATLEAAKAQSLLEADDAALIARAASKRFYKQRDWPGILATAQDAGLKDKPRLAFAAWLTDNRVDQKRLDACALIDAVRGAPQTPFHAGFALAETEMWRDLQAYAASLQGDHAIAEQARLLPQAGAWLAAARARARGLAASPRHVDDGRDTVSGSLRMRLGLWRATDVAQFEAANGLAPGGFAQLVDEDVRLAALDAALIPSLDGALLNELRLQGEFASIAARARDKAERLAAHGLDDVTPDSLGNAFVTALHRLHAHHGTEGDMSRLVQVLGFVSGDALTSALARDVAFHMLDANKPDGERDTQQEERQA